MHPRARLIYVLRVCSVVWSSREGGVGAERAIKRESWNPTIRTRTYSVSLVYPRIGIEGVPIGRSELWLNASIESKIDAEGCVETRRASWRSIQLVFSINSPNCPAIRNWRSWRMIVISRRRQDERERERGRKRGCKTHTTRLFLRACTRCS